MSDTVTKFAYHTLQRSKTSFALAHKSFSSQVFKFLVPSTPRKTQSLSPQILLKLQQRFEKLLETDWQDAEQGIYPTQLLFEHPWEDFLAFYPQVCFDLLQTWERATHKKNQDFS